MLHEQIVLNGLVLERRIDTPTAGRLIQKGPREARSVLERLQERGLVEGRGEKRRRVYHLSTQLYRRMNQPGHPVRAHGIEAIRHEEMVVAYVRKEGRIVRGEAASLCSLSNDQATRLLTRMVEKQWLTAKGSPPRWVFYVLGPRAPS